MTVKRGTGANGSAASENPVPGALTARAASVEMAEQQHWVIGILAALLPVVSFLTQYILSMRAGTQQFLFHHLTVMIVDWVFVPFNFFVVRVIDWRKGGTLYVIACISVVLNALTHAYWQYNGLDLGHMITKSGFVLPAGWVHVAFSTVQMILLVGFVFCRKSGAVGTPAATTFAVIYFLTMGACGYAMHGRFILSDVIVFVSGLFFVLVYPRITLKD